MRADFLGEKGRECLKDGGVAEKLFHGRNLGQHQSEVTPSYPNQSREDASERSNMTWTLSRFRTGDLVEVRSKGEILATLDENGCVDGMPFMPEMLQFCGKTSRVSAVAHKTCDTARRTWKGRRLQSTVHLAGLRCDGSAHDGCQAECNLFWKDVWLKPVGCDESNSARSTSHATNAHLGGCTEDQLLAHTRMPADSADQESRYACQATKLYDATELLPWWDLRQYVFDMITRNHPIGRVLRVLWLASLRLFLRHVPFGYRVVKSFHDATHRLLTGRPSPLVHGKIRRGEPTPTGRLDLRPGELVRIKSKDQIEETLDENALNRGLGFDQEMTPYCGRVFTVRHCVSKIIEEPTGRMLHMKQPCIMLEGVVCNAEYSRCRLMCPRAIPSYWREIWLERVTDDNR
jgi:hypothetical protein